MAKLDEKHKERVNQTTTMDIIVDDPSILKAENAS